MVTAILLLAAAGAFALKSPWWAIVLLLVALVWEVSSRLGAFERANESDRPVRISDNLTVIVLLLFGCSLGFVILVQLALWIWRLIGHAWDLADVYGRTAGWW